MVTRAGWGPERRGARGPRCKGTEFSGSLLFLASVRFRQFKNEIKTENKNRIGNTEKEIGLLMRNFSVRIFFFHVFRGKKTISKNIVASELKSFKISL